MIDVLESKQQHQLPKYSGGGRQCQNESSRMPRLRVWLTEVLLIILGGWSHKKYNEVFLAGVDGKLTTPDAELRHLFRCLST